MWYAGCRGRRLLLTLWPARAQVGFCLMFGKTLLFEQMAGRTRLLQLDITAGDVECRPWANVVCSPCKSDTDARQEVAAMLAVAHNVVYREEQTVVHVSPGRRLTNGLQTPCETTLSWMWALPQLLETPVACQYCQPQLWPPQATAEPRHPPSSSCCCLPVCCLSAVLPRYLCLATHPEEVLRQDQVLLPLLELQLRLAVPCWDN